MSKLINEITQLLYRYTELIDSGDLKATAALFEHAQIKVRNSNVFLDADELLALWRKHLIIYPCGTPRTKHLVTNPIIKLDNSKRHATCRSYYSVYQSTENFPLQLIAAGRYYDEFEKENDSWHFSFRDYSMLDFTGNMRFHLKPA